MILRKKLELSTHIDKHSVVLPEAGIVSYVIGVQILVPFPAKFGFLSEHQCPHLTKGQQMNPPHSTGYRSKCTMKA